MTEHDEDLDEGYCDCTCETDRSRRGWRDPHCPMHGQFPEVLPGERAKAIRPSERRPIPPLALRDDLGELSPTPEETRLYAAIQAVILQTRGFNERKQESWCRVCRFKDPLGQKLHDPECSIYELHGAFEEWAKNERIKSAKIREKGIY